MPPGTDAGPRGTVTFSPGLHGWVKSTREARSGVQSRWRSGCQKPMKSGLPSGCRGAGAFRSGVPSASRGTFGVGYVTHWANVTFAENVRTSAVNTTAPRDHAPSWVRTLARSRKQPLPRACQDHYPGVGMQAAVPRAASLDSDRVTGLQRIARPA